MQSFEIGRTISRTFSLIAKTMTSAGLFALAIQTISVLSFMLMQGQLVSGMQGLDRASDLTAALGVLRSVWFWAVLLLSIFLSSISFAGSIHGFLKASDGVNPTLVECLHAGAAKMLPVFGLTVLWMLGVGLGSILFLFPGIILTAMWSASLPVLVGEHSGVFAAFGRSRALTRGFRLKIFGLLLVVLVVIFGLMDGVEAALFDEPTGIKMSWTYALTSIPMGWLTSLVLNATLTSIYLETVEIKQGGTHAHLAEVFG